MNNTLNKISKNELRKRVGFTNADYDFLLNEIIENSKKFVVINSNYYEDIKYYAKRKIKSSKSLRGIFIEDDKLIGLENESEPIILLISLGEYHIDSDYNIFLENTGKESELETRYALYVDKNIYVRNIHQKYPIKLKISDGKLLKNDNFNYYAEIIKANESKLYKISPFVGKSWYIEYFDEKTSESVIKFCLYDNLKNKFKIKDDRRRKTTKEEFEFLFREDESISLKVKRFIKKLV